jgi:predicted RNA-binding protein with PUA domain
MDFWPATQIMANNSKSQKIQITSPNEERFHSSLDLNLIQLLWRKKRTNQKNYVYSSELVNVGSPNATS